MIAFVGSVFSPYYHWSGRRDPEDHCAINVVLYGAGFGRWAMTERGRAAVSRDATRFTVGPSSLSWDGDALVIDVDEITVPLPRPLRGRIRVEPSARTQRSFAIDAAGRHRWMPLAPKGRATVSFSEPSLSWRGHAYVDTNAGVEPIPRAFRAWDWSRADIAGGTAVLYDVVEADGRERSIAVRYRGDGSCEDFAAPPRVDLPPTLWRVPRRTQAEPGGAGVRVVRTLEDTPFYTRSVLATRLFGEDVPAVHESLSARRLDTAIVRLMLPFRMPRRSA